MRPHALAIASRTAEALLQGLGLASCLWCAAAAWAQAPQPAAAPGAPPAATAAPAPAAGPAVQAGPAPVALDGQDLLRHLNAVVSWYGHITTDIQMLGLPSEVLYQDQAQSLAAQVVKLAFQSARAGAVLVKAQENARPGAGGNDRAQRRAQAEARTAAKVQDLQAQVAALEAKLPSLAGARRADLEAQVARARGQLDLQQALLDAIRKMKAFAAENGGTAGDLAGSIDQLARTVPEALGQGTDAPKPAAAAAGAGPARPAFASSGGLLSQVASLYDCMTSERKIKDLLERTDRLRVGVEKTRTPLRDALRSTIQESQAQADRPLPADGSAAEIKAEIQSERALTDRFKGLAGALLPLSQETLLLDDSKANLERWRDLVQRASGRVLRAVLGRVAVILVVLGLILALSEAWRRVTFRYVQEPRRRRQFLVLRRVVSGLLIVIVVVLGFVTDFSSLATFAGFITAGIAVGLQAVLLSVAAYFLIIGRYGIRVGDRITIAGTTGDVLDVGLVRFYLMELAGTGMDFRPTGRIVVFSNSVLFQAGTPLFRQIPGAEYAWHEMVVALVPEGDHQAVQDKLLGIVEEAYAGHRVEMERQHEVIAQRGEIQVEAPRPETRMQLGDAGLELLVRYPVPIRDAKAVDELVTRKVLDLVGIDPDLKAAVKGTPKIRSMNK